MGQLEYTKARAIAKLKDPGERQQLLEKAIVENFSLAQIKEKLKQQSPKLEPLNFNRRISKIEQAIRRKGLLEDLEKQQEIEKLLKSLESLIGD